MDVEEAFQIIAEMGDDPESYENELTRHDGAYEELIRRAGILHGSRVLELGCGTGPVTVKLAQRLGPKGYVAGIDVNQEMLKIAKEKKDRLGLLNLELTEMNMEKLRFPDNSFDHVISSFGICCCFYYDKTLREACRVLRPGGKITYNHEGPRSSDASQAFDRIFAKYKTYNPSEKLKKKREADSLQSGMWDKYGDPFIAVPQMRKVGFKNPEASIAGFSLVFQTPEEFIDYSVAGSLEFSEMGPRDQAKFRKECSDALKEFLVEEKLVTNEPLIFYTGYK